jgi:hypothetical protein
MSENDQDNMCAHVRCDMTTAVPLKDGAIGIWTRSQIPDRDCGAWTLRPLPPCSVLGRAVPVPPLGLVGVLCRLGGGGRSLSVRGHSDSHATKLFAVTGGLRRVRQVSEVRRPASVFCAR